ncbi:helix-turn-helix domain-containing protein [Streptomyces sp. ISL-43]|uniref:helix-turn-helix domain-containing protein n=1 Tax=Streptomyces sp. ISL-43 TaxID=2819183 RepID=UPI001BE57FB8|nr:helix-turn-helix domain-containing protein [Streptomyces sp. ISL-43]MBT2449469.1 helix-turn-helix domain-containing protein [Streptomyces sp. ISL-43]
MATQKQAPHIPVTPDEHDELRRLHAEGHSRNEIARRMDRSGRTISHLAVELGLTFDRTKTAIATQARVIDGRTRRIALTERLYAQSEKILARLERDEHHIVEVSIGKVVRYTAADLPSADVRNLLNASALAMNQAVKLESIDSNGGIDDAKSMLGQLAAGLTAAYTAMNEVTEGDGDAP